MPTMGLGKIQDRMAIVVARENLNCKEDRIRTRSLVTKFLAVEKKLSDLFKRKPRGS
jgi:hypothetical protein